MKKKTPARAPRRSQPKTAVSVPRTPSSNVPTVAATPPSAIVPAITASLDLPVGPDGLIDSVSAKFERFVMEQIRAGEQVCAASKRQLAECQQRFQQGAQRAAERRAEAARPHLEQARRSLNLPARLQLECEVAFDEQDEGPPQASVMAKFFSERRPGSYGNWTYAGELEIEFQILLSDMDDEPRQAWEALQSSRQHHQQQTELLIAWRKKLAEIPYVQRQAKAHLTDVLLQQSEPGRQLYQTMQQQFQKYFSGLPEFCDGSLSA